MSLVINQLSKRIDHHQTLDISFEMDWVRSSVLAVTGLTTLFRAINGQYLTDHGMSWLMGEAVDQPEMRRNCVLDHWQNF